MARMLSSSGQVAPQKGFSHESLNSRDIELLPENSYRDEEDTDVAAYRQAKAHRRVMKRRHVEQQLLLQQKRSEAQAEQDSIEVWNHVLVYVVLYGCNRALPPPTATATKANSVLS